MERDGVGAWALACLVCVGAAGCALERGGLREDAPSVDAGRDADDGSGSANDAGTDAPPGAPVTEDGGRLGAVGCPSSCSEGRVCDDGMCVCPEGACCPACDEGEACEGGRCVPETCEPTCTENEVCREGRCVCPEDACCPGCIGAEVCHGGVCRPPGADCGLLGRPCCDGTPSCHAGAVCVEDRCRECGFQGQPCCTDGSCLTPFTCRSDSVCRL